MVSVILYVGQMKKCSNNTHSSDLKWAVKVDSWPVELCVRQRVWILLYLVLYLDTAAVGHAAALTHACVYVNKLDPPALPL